MKKKKNEKKNKEKQKKVNETLFYRKIKKNVYTYICTYILKLNRNIKNQRKIAG